MSDRDPRAALALVDDGAGRPRVDIQERLTVQIADRLQAELRPAGVGVVLQAEHMCMSLRASSNPEPGPSPRHCAGRSATTPRPARSSWP